MPKISEAASQNEKVAVSYFAECKVFEKKITTTAAVKAVTTVTTHEKISEVLSKYASLRVT